MVIFSNDFDHEEVQCGNLRIFLPLKIYVKSILPFKMAFFATQILCEIKIGDSRVLESSNLTQLEALNFDFLEFLYFLKG